MNPLLLEKNLWTFTSTLVCVHLLTIVFPPDIFDVDSRVLTVSRPLLPRVLLYVVPLLSRDGFHDVIPASPHFREKRKYLTVHGRFTVSFHNLCVFFFSVHLLQFVWYVCVSYIDLSIVNLY